MSFNRVEGDYPADYQNLSASPRMAATANNRPARSKKALSPNAPDAGESEEYRRRLLQYARHNLIFDKHRFSCYCLANYFLALKSQALPNNTALNAVNRSTESTFHTTDIKNLSTNPNWMEELK